MTVTGIDDYLPRDDEPFPESNGMPREAPQPVVNEEEMLELADRLEDESTAFKELCDEAATADADYHLAFYSMMVELTGVRPAEVRKAKAHLAAEKEYRRWRLLKERQSSSRAMMAAITTKLDVRRTLAVNYRHQG